MRHSLPRLGATGLIAAFLCGAAEAKTFTVNFLLDLPDLVPGDGVCSAGGGLCTLRAAIMEANAFVDATPNVIKILGPAEIQLTLTSGDDDPAFGDLNVLADLRIEGEGPLATTIEGTGTERVFDVEAALELSNLTIRGGRATGTPGGGIRVRDGGDLTCRNCWILDNRSTSHGGGIYVEPAGLATIEDSRIAGNMTSGGGGCGGGLAVRGAATVARSLVESNRAHGNFFTESWGGGICSFFGSAISIRESAIVGNEVDGGSESYGGGIAFVNGSWDLLNVTISGNRAASAGGGMAMVFSTTTALNNVTVADNTAHDGGGFAAVSGATPLVAANSIFADNTAAGDGPDCLGVITSAAGHNLLENVNDCAFTGTTTGNELGVDPMLLPLGGYGGPTPTHELASTDSPAFAGGSNASCETFDQRGVARPRGTCEMGATEFVGLVPIGAGQGGVIQGVTDFNLHLLPTWGNISASDAAVTSTAISISGPGSPANVTLSITDANAGYGTIGAGFFASCLTTNNCIDFHAVAGFRPAEHWDVVVTEKTAALPLSAPWRVHLLGGYADILAEGSLVDMEAAAHAGTMRRCKIGEFCPRGPLTRGQLAMILERARRGADYPPLDATGGLFSDVPANDPRAPWIELFAQDGLSAGCGPDPDGNGGPLRPPFCPDAPLQRQQAAVWFVAATRGASFMPPACAAGGEKFADVPATHPNCPFIEELARQGVTWGCAMDPDGNGPLKARFCPTDPLPRHQLASFLTRAYGYELVTF